MLFPLFLIPILVGLVAQALKRFFNKQWYAELSAGGRKIPRYGGMPSAHTAFSFSLATTVALAEGFGSASFAIAASLVIFILDDALRMRIFLSRHGEALQKLIDRLPEEQQRTYPYLETRMGHKIHEVIAGAVLGIGLTLVTMLLFGIF